MTARTAGKPWRPCEGGRATLMQHGGCFKVTQGRGQNARLLMKASTPGWKAACIPNEAGGRRGRAVGFERNSKPI